MKNKFTDTCFQCGKPRIKTKEYTEIVNGSKVVSVESICSDPECQKRTSDMLESERMKRSHANENKQKRGFGVKK